MNRSALLQHRLRRPQARSRCDIYEEVFPDGNGTFRLLIWLDARQPGELCIFQRVVDILPKSVVDLCRV
jgi:hypothetical protein